MAPRVLVVGASGFIGEEVVRQLTATQECQVVALARRPGPPVDIVADITRPDELSRVSALGRFDAVVNASGLAHEFGSVARERFFEVNAAGAGEVAKLAARLGARRLVHISSVAVYGSGSTMPAVESSECHPAGAYGESKLEGERVVLEVCRDQRVPVSILRPSTVVGQGDRGNVARLIDAIIGGRFVMVGSGVNRKSLVCKEDVARAAVHRVLQASHPVEVFNVSAGEFAMAQIVGWIREEAGKRGLGPRVPAPVATTCLRFGAAAGIRPARRALQMLSKWLSEDAYAGDAIRTTGFSYACQPEAAVRLETRRLVESA